MHTHTHTHANAHMHAHAHTHTHTHAAFNTARNHDIERENYLEHLRKG